MPTPDEIAAAARELAEARAEYEAVNAEVEKALIRRSNLSSRVANAATALRQITDRLAPPPSAKKVPWNE